MVDFLSGLIDCRLRGVIGFFQLGEQHNSNAGHKDQQGQKTAAETVLLWGHSDFHLGLQGGLLSRLSALI